jgi:hypothetical protein
MWFHNAACGWDAVHRQEMPEMWDKYDKRAITTTTQIKEKETMPRGDGTGPMGMGPMSGRAAGFCAGYDVPGYMNPIFGRGFGRGLGWGRGRGFGAGMGFRRGWGGRAGYGMGTMPAYNPYFQEPSKTEELEMLKQQAEYFEKSLGEIREHIKDIESEKGKK